MAPTQRSEVSQLKLSSNFNLTSIRFLCPGVSPSYRSFIHLSHLIVNIVEWQMSMAVEEEMVSPKDRVQERDMPLER